MIEEREELDYGKLLLKILVLTINNGCEYLQISYFTHCKVSQKEIKKLRISNFKRYAASCYVNFY